MFTMEIFEDKAALSAAAAERIIRAASAAVADHGRFLLVLAGGSTPEETYKLLAAPERRERIDWTRTYIFFGDERLVPHDDPRSNYGMADNALLRHAPIPKDQIFPIPADGSGAEAARRYEENLREFFGVDKPPRFDLTLLGLGDDGHTASLFPGMPALQEETQWAISTPPGVLPPPVDRITLTFPILNASREVVFLIAGAGKADPVQAILEQFEPLETYPAAGINAPNGEVRWMLDRAAAGKLV